MRPKCLKCIILWLESLFSFESPLITCVVGARSLKDVYLFGFLRGSLVVPRVLGLMALDEGSRTENFSLFQALR